MPPSDTEILERVGMLQTANALNDQAIKGLQASNLAQGTVIEKIQDSLSTVKSQIAAFGVVNTLTLAWIAYRLTKGT